MWKRNFANCKYAGHNPGNDLEHHTNLPLPIGTGSIPPEIRFQVGFVASECLGLPRSALVGSPRFSDFEVHPEAPGVFAGAPGDPASCGLEDSFPRDS